MEARVSGVVLLREDGAALLQHRDEKPEISAPGQWVFPGGHCESDELSIECARREFLEETGYRCGELVPVTELSYRCRDTGRSFRMSFWRANYDGVSPTHCYEGQAVRFVLREEAGQLRIPEYLLSVWDCALSGKTPPLPLD